MDPQIAEELLEQRCAWGGDIDANVGVREMLLLSGDKFKPVGVSDLSSQQALTSKVLPSVIRLLPQPTSRPQVKASKPSTGERWLA